MSHLNQPPNEGSSPAAEASLRHTVLVVDDEFQVRDLVRRVLDRENLTVLTAGSVAEALALLERCRGAVDLVLSDITMPEQDGWALFREVRTRWPNTDMLFMSGHHHSLLEPAETGELKPMVLAKPFTIESLTAAVRLALET